MSSIYSLVQLIIRRPATELVAFIIKLLSISALPLLNLYLVSAFDTRQYAQYALTITAFFAIAGFYQLGLPERFLIDASKIPNNSDGEMMSVAVNCFGTATFLALGGVLASFLGVYLIVASLTAALAVSFAPLLAFGFLVSALLKRQARYAMAQFVEALPKLGVVVISLSLVGSDFGALLLSVFIGSTLCSLIVVTAVLGFERVYANIDRVDAKKILHIVSDILPFFFTGILQFAKNYGAFYLSYFFFDHEIVKEIFLAINISLIAALPSMIIISVYQSVLAKQVGSSEVSPESSLFSGVRLISTVFNVFFILLLLLTVIFFHDFFVIYEVSDVLNIAIIFMCGRAFICFQGPVIQNLHLSGCVRLVNLILLGNLFVLILLSLILGVVFGANGLIAAHLLSMVVYGFVLSIIRNRNINAGNC